MRVPAGYKASEVGVIPADWGVSNLSEVFSITAGGDFDPKIASPIFTSNHPFPVYANALKTNAVHSFASEHRHLQKSVTVSARGMIGFANYRDHPFTAIGRLLVLQPNGSNDGRYFAEYINHRIEFAIESTGVPQLTAPQIGSYLVAVPSPLEQSAIAEALSDVDRGIAAVEAVIAKKRALKTATMQALLSGTRRLPGFSGEWEMKLLGQLGHFSKGQGINRGQVTATGLPCIRYGEIYTRHNDIVRAFHSHIPLSVAEQSKLLTKGDLLFAGSGETAAEIGKCVAYVSDQGAYAGGDIVILSLVTGNPVFFGYLLNSPEIAEQKARLGQGDAVVHISAGALAQIKLKIPPIEEQSAIATIMVDLDDDLTIQNDKLQKLRRLKTGMMQQLLTGKIRLI